MPDAEALVAALTLDEKAALLAGRDGWHTTPVPRLGIPAVRLTDGPNGARGTALFGAGEQRAVCVPCGTALAAAWDPDLVQRVGALLGDETRSKGARVLLAPTVNIHRSPLAGRNFECFSEDPLLAGRIAAAYVRGVQSRGVATTVKHLAGNEAEFERYTMSSDIDERALREIYLLPFELAVREGAAVGVMTSYNRLNGAYCSEDGELLEGILRDEWGFEGFVVSDWFAAVDTRRSARAGLDLEMPGPARAYGPALADAVRAGEVQEADVDRSATRLLSVLAGLGALDDPEDAPETTVEAPAQRELAREAAIAGTVLLRNEGLLPLGPEALGTVAVIGPNADRAQVMGGGSARLRPQYAVTPLEAIRARLGEHAEVVFETGCDIDRTVPALAGNRVTAADGGPGFDVELFAGLELAGEPVYRGRRGDGLLFFFDPPAPGLSAGNFSARARGRFTATASGPHRFTIQEGGEARLLVDGELVVDGTVQPPRSGDYFGMVSEALEGAVDLQAGQAVELVLEYVSRDVPSEVHGAKLGCRAPLGEDALDRAAAAAAAADVAVVVVGTTDDWESEGFDRTSMDLPGPQDELVDRVLAANPRTVVVVNAGSPVTMPWADRAPAVLQAWFGGQEMASGLAAILAGDADPGGRLPTTLPLRLEHNPSFGAFPGENSHVPYAESVLVGYRWYQARRLPVRFPFGHGLSYSSFELGTPSPASADFIPGTPLTVEVEVVNTGERAGSEVVQCYVSPLDPVLVRPPRELKAFAKVHLAPGERTTVSLELGDRAFAHWDPGDPEWPGLRERMRGASMALADAGRPVDGGWRIAPGRYELHIGRSSADIAHVVPVRVAAGADVR